MGPTFTVSDWAVAEPIMAEFVEATKKETGCIYYGWTRNDDKLFCREAYVDAAATLDQIELHGPAAEVEKCKEKMDGFGTKYFTIDLASSAMRSSCRGARYELVVCACPPLGVLVSRPDCTMDEYVLNARCMCVRAE